MIEAIRSMLAPPDEVARRLAVCATCVHKTSRPIFGGNVDICDARTCKCPIASKSRLAATTCPKSKW